MTLTAIIFPSIVFKSDFIEICVKSRWYKRTKYGRIHKSAHKSMADTRGETGIGPVLHRV